MTLPKEEAIEATYNDVKYLIVDTCHRFREVLNGDVEEYLADSQVFFMRAYLTYDPSKGKAFSTWVRDHVWNGLMMQQRRRLNRERLLGRAGVEMDCLPSRSSSWTLKSFLAELSEDATIVVGLAVLPPKDMAHEIAERGGQPQNFRTVIRETLLSMGWTIDRVVESFQEIQKALR